MKKINFISISIFLSFLFLTSCSIPDQSQLLTEIAKVGQTALSESGGVVQTEAAHLKETAVAIAATKLAEGQGLKETADSILQTQLASGPGYTRQFDSIAGNDDLLIGAYFYPWWGPGRDHWANGYTESPTLGEYSSADKNIINKQIDWATGHGVDFFTVSWWGQNSEEDLVFKNSLLKSELSSDILFAVVYESQGLLKASPDGTINLNDPQNSDKLLNDFIYLQENYWNSNNYLKIDNKPVVYIYLSRLLVGDLESEFEHLREQIRQNGQDVYIIADEVYWQEFHAIDSNRIKIFDAITSYNMHASVDDIENNFTQKVLMEFTAWRESSINIGVTFVPSVIPGFNDTFVRPEANHPIINRSVDLFVNQLNMAMNTMDSRLKLVMITSWNEWHEGTSIEPASEFGFDYLIALKQELAK